MKRAEILNLRSFLFKMNFAKAKSRFVTYAVAVYYSYCFACQAICPLTIVYFTEDAICNGLPS